MAKARTKATPSARAKAKPSARAKAKPAARKKPARVSTHPPKHRSAETLALIERLRAACMMPGVVEQIAWGEPTWRVGGKMFAMCDTYHHGSPHLSVHLAAPPGAQEALIDTDPARFYRPPYTGGKGWVGVVLDTGPDWEMVASLARTARDFIAGGR